VKYEPHVPTALRLSIVEEVLVLVSVKPKSSCIVGINFTPESLSGESIEEVK
jgi:hypothetical protein